MSENTVEQMLEESLRQLSSRSEASCGSLVNASATSASEQGVCARSSAVMPACVGRVWRREHVEWLWPQGHLLASTAAQTALLNAEIAA